MHSFMCVHAHEYVHLDIPKSYIKNHENLFSQRVNWKLSAPCNKPDL